jgi:hypothetical protein
MPPPSQVERNWVPGSDQELNYVTIRNKHTTKIIVCLRTNLKHHIVFMNLVIFMHVLEIFTC